MANDSAFFDRMHCYIPGWEIPKYRPEYFTNDYGFITDYFAEVLRELRKVSFADAIDKYFKLGNNLNQRDVIAVKKTVSGLAKLLYPDGNYNKKQIEVILRFALEMRRRVKEQLKKIGGMEFYDVNFSYIDNENFIEEFVSVPEQGGGTLIPEGLGKPGHLYTIGKGLTGMIGTYKLETQISSGSGKFTKTGIGTNREAKEAMETAYKYLVANYKNISASIGITETDYLVDIQDLNGIGITNQLTIQTTTWVNRNLV
jgi:ATP-dependent Lon protease